MSNGNYDIRGAITGSGYARLDDMGADLTRKINGAGSDMTQVDLIKLQQQISAYTNTISMMSNILKNLGDTDKEVIRAM
ncbi:MAG: EscF/YscF/HrpA family type III secretion system needle major subunit [Planctomycetota bacterium]|jgi:hypothetical protein|nr:EscF/YscF/HrpA family type III secretion system needle major subunit [Planctomycetota bacterium]